MRGALGFGDFRRGHARHAGDTHDPDVVDPVDRVILVERGEGLPSRETATTSSYPLTAQNPPYWVL